MSVQQKDLDIIKNTTNKFFKEFNTQTINNTLESNNAFLEKISEYFTDKLNPNSENSFNTQNKNDKSASDIKKTTYYNIKTLYDKFCGLNSESSNTNYIVQKIEDLNKISIENFNKNLFYNLKFSDDECFGAKENIEYDLYQIFQIVDRGNNDIGTKVLADLSYLYENLYAEFDSQPIAGQPDQNATVNNLTKGSFQKLFSGLAVQSGFLFQQIPNYLNLNSAISSGDESFISNVVDDLFGVHTTTSLAGAEIFKNKNNTKFGGLFGLPGYIFQLGTATSSLDNKENVKNNYTNSFCLDIGLDNNREITVKDEDLPDEIKNSNITCFAVDFSSQKQQMFNNIQLDTNEFYETEESIRVWVDAVNATDNYLQTSNLFPIMEKRSYTCTVTSLGNATIQPLSYFYLRNVPLFNGTYWITNVNHKINDNTMLTTFKGVRQPIISKSDTRKQLLELLRSKADALLKASDNANRVITEGISDTEGLIKQIESSDKPYGSIIQERKDDNGYQEFDAKTLIGSFIYSITNSNDDKDANNLGIIATLYNQAKAYIGSEEHAKIIKNIKNIVVGKIKIAANDDDKRYCQTKSEPSLSVLYKNSGYSNIGKLSSLLDDILNESDYNRLIKLPKNIKLYTLTNTNDNQIQLQIGNEITTAKSENIPINEATIYLDHNPSFIIKSNTSFAGSEYNGKSLTANDILTSLSGNTINVSKQVNDVPIKYLGTFTLSKNVSFYSVNNGNLTFNDNTKRIYDIGLATPDDLNQLSSDPNLNINSLERDSVIRGIITNAKNEYNIWQNNNFKDNQYGSNTTVTNLLDKYWKAATGSDKYNPNLPWSAAFISYIVKQASPSTSDFKYSAAHNTYIIDARSGAKSWKAYSTKDNGVILQEGDLLCYGRDGGKKIAIELKDFVAGQTAHCDCVTEIDPGKNAKIIGGNLSNSVSTGTVNLNSNGSVNDLTRTVILRYQPTTLASKVTVKNNNSGRGNEQLGLQGGSIESTLAETESFLTDVLKGIGISSPNTSQIKFMKIWRQHEGGKAAWNPFNTTLKKPDSSKYNSVPVRNYADRQTGLDATIETLKNGRYNKVIDAIVKIKKDSDIDLAISAVNASPWGSKFDPTSYKSWLTLNNLIWKPPFTDKV